MAMAKSEHSLHLFSKTQFAASRILLFFFQVKQKEFIKNVS